MGSIAAADATNIELNGTSDVRLKTDIKNTSLKGLDIINALRLRDFKWNDKAKDNIIGKQEIGRWIADEVNDVYPDAVNGTPGRMKPVKDENGNKTGEEEIFPINIMPARFIAPMMNAIQELSAKVEALEKAK